MHVSQNEKTDMEAFFSAWVCIPVCSYINTVQDIVRILQIVLATFTTDVEGRVCSNTVFLRYII